MLEEAEILSELVIEVKQVGEYPVIGKNVLQFREQLFCDCGKDRFLIAVVVSEVANADACLIGNLLKADIGQAIFIE